MTQTYQFEAFEVHACERQLRIHGQPVALGARAFDVLLALAQRSQQTVSKAELLALVWPDSMVEENNLTVQICNLRKWLGAKTIATIAGRGYRLSVPPLRQPLISTGAGNFPMPAAAPEQHGSLFGRDAETTQLQTLLQRHALVTVLGAGGIGKTSLAWAAARTWKHAQPDTATVWVDLSQLGRGDSVCAAIANTMNIRLGPTQDDLTQLQVALAPLPLLLILDNAEHLVEDVARVVQAVLVGATQLKILVTSQVALRLPGERLCRVAGLAVPPAEATPEQAIHFASMALLLHRAQSLYPQFSLCPANVGAMSDICRQLDGLPLALELAAVRLPLLGVQGVLDRLSDRFKLLACGPRFAPDRQQTLQAALDWSHALLPLEQRIVFRRLAVFNGGFTMALAAAVAAQDGDDEWAVIEHLDALVDRSFVVVEDSEPPRYRLLETPRAYALAQLADAGEGALMRGRHAHALRDVCGGLAQDFIVESDAVFLRRYHPELDNFRLALAWALQHDPDCAVELAGALARIHNFLASHVEALEQVEAAEALVSEQTPPLLRARLRVGRALYSRSQTLATAMAALREAIDLFRTLHQTVEFVHAVANVSYRCQAHDAPEVEALCLEARRLCAGESRPNVRFTLSFAEFALAMHHQRLDDMHVLLDECMALARAGGYDDYVQLVQWNRAMLAVQAGDFRVAQTLACDMLGFAQSRHGNSTWMLNGQAVLLLACTGLCHWHEAQQAAQRFAALALPANRFHEFSDVVAFLHAQRGDAAGAARLLGFADAACERLQAKRVAHFRSRTLELMTSQLGPGRLQALLGLGRTLEARQLGALVHFRAPSEAAVNV